MTDETRADETADNPQSEPPATQARSDETADNQQSEPPSTEARSDEHKVTGPTQGDGIVYKQAIYGKRRAPTPETATSENSGRKMSKRQRKLPAKFH